MFAIRAVVRENMLIKQLFNVQNVMIYVKIVKEMNQINAYHVLKVGIFTKNNAYCNVLRDFLKIIILIIVLNVIFHVQYVSESPQKSANNAFRVIFLKITNASNAILNVKFAQIKPYVPNVTKATF
jgi:hypothetical protein